MQTEKKGWIIGWTQIAIFVCLGIWLITSIAVGPYNATLNGWVLCAVYLVGIIFALRLNNKKAYPFVIFLGYCFLSNLGQTMTHILGISNESNFDIYEVYQEELIGKMLFIQGVFVLFMILGYMLVRRPKDIQGCLDTIRDDQDNSIGIEELIFLAASLYVGVTYLRELVQRTDMSYGEYYYDAREGVGTVMQYVYHVSAFSYLIRHKGWKQKMAYLITAVLAVMALFIGARSATLPLVVGCIFIIMLSQKDRLKFKFRYVVFGLILLFIFSRFTVLREYALSELSLPLLVEIFAVSPVRALADVVQEMGVSARTVLTTMKALESGAITQEGTILYSLLKGLIPIPILDFLGVPAPAISSLSAWVSEYGGKSDGWGYSIIAEIIYNFGGWGFLYSALFGGFIAFLENITEKLLLKGQHFLASGILYVLGYGVFLARAETTLLATRIRYTVYFAILLLMIKLIMNDRKRIIQK